MFKIGDVVYVKEDCNGYGYVYKETYLATYEGKHYFTDKDPVDVKHCKLLTEKEAIQFKTEARIKDLKRRIKEYKKSLTESEEELAELTKED